MTREKYKDLIIRMEQSAQRPANVKSRLRDCIHMNRSRWCTTAFLTGLTLATFSGKVFFDRFSKTLEEAQSIRQNFYDNIEARLEKASEPRVVEYNPVMEYSSLGIFAGTGLALGSILMGTMKPYKHWSYNPKQSKQRL